MIDKEFRSFLDLIMVSDPWPLDLGGRAVLEEYANRQSRLRGYDNWTDAYHRFTGQGRIRMKIFELSAAIIVFLMHYTVTQYCVVKEDPFGFVFAALAIVSVIWIRVAAKRGEDENKYL